MKKIIIAILVLLVVYNSIYIKKLSALQQETTDTKGNAKQLQDLYQKGIIENSLQTELGKLIQELNNQPEQIFKEKGNLMGISNSKCFLVNGAAQITNIKDGLILLDNGSSLDTKYIFGNELRDASRFLQLADFQAQKDLNHLTEALNDTIREKILPPQVAILKVGDHITYIGACMIHKNELPIAHLIIFPAIIKKS